MNKMKSPNQKKTDRRDVIHTDGHQRRASGTEERNRPMAPRSMSLWSTGQEAEIARATFYLHFDSLNEVLDSVIDEALLFSESGSGTVVDVLDIIRSGRSDVLRENETVLPACQRIADSDKYHHLFMDVSVSDHIIQRIAAHEHDSVVPDLMAHTGLAADEAEMLFKFILNGSFTVNRSLSWEK